MENRTRKPELVHLHPVILINGISTISIEDDRKSGIFSTAANDIEQGLGTSSTSLTPIMQTLPVIHINEELYRSLENLHYTRSRSNSVVSQKPTSRRNSVNDRSTNRIRKASTASNYGCHKSGHGYSKRLRLNSGEGFAVDPKTQNGVEGDAGKVKSRKHSTSSKRKLTPEEIAKEKRRRCVVSIVMTTFIFIVMTSVLAVIFTLTLHNPTPNGSNMMLKRFNVHVTPSPSDSPLRKENEELMHSLNRDYTYAQQNISQPSIVVRNGTGP